MMEDVVDLADTDVFPSSQMPLGPDSEHEAGAVDTDCALPTAPVAESR